MEKLFFILKELKKKSDKVGGSIEGNTQKGAMLIKVCYCRGCTQKHKLKMKFSRSTF